MLSVLATSVSVWPATFVSVPSPLSVDAMSVSAVLPVFSVVATLAVDDDSVSAATAGDAPLKAAVVPLSVSVPAPPMVEPTSSVNVPPATVIVRPVLTVIVPLFVKLGVVPLCVSVRFAALRSIVPLFT